MGLITKEVEIGMCPRTIRYYENLGYIIFKRKDVNGTPRVPRNFKLLVRVEDLTRGSNAKIDIKCDNCGKILTNIKWQDYLKQVKEDNKYYCKKCSNNLFGAAKRIKLKLKNSKSFEQWCTENCYQNLLDRWDYNLNNYSPSDIGYSTNKKFYFICPQNLHKSELKSINDFTRGCGSMDCTVCNSLAYKFPKSLDVWSGKNKKSPYEYTPFSKKRVWWKCPDGKHKDFYRSICESNTYDFRCPECQFSQGEKKIEKFLMINDIIYVPQKEFNNLTGIGNRNLSYDFYLLYYNLLIEYQGQQHERPVKFKGDTLKSAQEKFIIQQEHDRRKKEYAKNHKINLLEIWYWDFDNIETILLEELNLRRIN